MQFLFRRNELSSIHPSPTPQKTETGTEVLVFGPRATKKVALMQERKIKTQNKTTRSEKTPMTEQEKIGSVGEERSKIREHFGNPRTEKKTEKINSVGEDGSKIREYFGGNPGTEKKTENSTRLGRMGPKSVSILEGILNRKGNRRKSTRLGRVGPKSVRIFGGAPKTEKENGKNRLGWEGWVQNP